MATATEEQTGGAESQLRRRRTAQHAADDAPPVAELEIREIFDEEEARQLLREYVAQTAVVADMPGSTAFGRAMAHLWIWRVRARVVADRFQNMLSAAGARARLLPGELAAALRAWRARAPLLPGQLAAGLRAWRARVRPALLARGVGGMLVAVGGFTYLIVVAEAVTYTPPPSLGFTLFGPVVSAAHSALVAFVAAFLGLVSSVKNLIIFYSLTVFTCECLLVTMLGLGGDPGILARGNFYFFAPPRARGELDLERGNEAEAVEHEGVAGEQEVGGPEQENRDDYQQHHTATFLILLVLVIVAPYLRPPAAVPGSAVPALSSLTFTSSSIARVMCVLTTLVVVIRMKLLRCGRAIHQVDRGYGIGWSESKTTWWIQVYGNAQVGVEQSRS